jgi:hypothetical protein
VSCPNFLEPKTFAAVFDQGAFGTNTCPKPTSNIFDVVFEVDLEIHF